MRKFVLTLAALALAFGGVLSGPVEGRADVPDVAKWQPCYREALDSGKVRYSVEPRAEFEVEALRIAGKTARVDASGRYYRVMESQEFAGKHYVYLDIYGEAQGFSTWARCKPLYPKEH